MSTKCLLDFTAKSRDKKANHLSLYSIVFSQLNQGLI